MSLTPDNPAPSRMTPPAATPAPGQAPASVTAQASGRAPASATAQASGGWSRGTKALVVGLAVAVLAVLAALTVPVNVVIEGPGPTWNVLGKADDETTPLISVSGTQTYPTEGTLRMVTVSVRGCPGYPVHAVDVLAAWISDEEDIIDRDEVCPSSLSQEEVDDIGQQQMTMAEDAAVVAALLETGEAEGTYLEVVSAVDGQDTATTRAGDVLTALTTPDGTTTEVTSFDQLRETMTTIAPDTTLTLDVIRDGQAAQATLTTQTPPDDDGDGQPDRDGSMLGLYLGIHADSPANATFALEDVGGPSAGMVFALGIVDALTPGDLTGGVDVAGTGTIDVDGSVGAIGGIEQKMAGAARDGATYFLAPADNCAEVVGHVPDGLQVVAVSTLHEAVQAMEAIAAGEGGLQTCESVLGR